MLFKYKILLAIVANLLYSAALVYGGYYYRDNLASAEISQLKQNFAQDKLVAEQKYSEQLSGGLKRYEQWVQTAQQINQAATAQTQQIHNMAAKQKKDIPYVLQKDNAIGDCFSIDSLQHYRQSLGYK